MMSAFEDLTPRQKVIGVALVVLTSIVGAWWYESRQSAWSWVGFGFTAVYIASVTALFKAAEIWFKKRFQKEKGSKN